MSNTIRIKWAVVLTDELETKSAILIHQLKSLDFIEHTSQVTLNQVKTLIKVITD